MISKKWVKVFLRVDRRSGTPLRGNTWGRFLGFSTPAGQQTPAGDFLEMSISTDESKRTKQSSYKHDLAKEAMMKYINKTLRPRLPVELREKLRDGKGSGRHKDKKVDFKRRPKHKNQEGF